MKKLLGYVIMLSPFITIFIYLSVVNLRAVLVILGAIVVLVLSVFLMAWGSSIVEDSEK